MTYTKLKVVISNINLINIFVGFGLFTSIFLSNSSGLLTTQITVPFRALSLVLSIITILINLNSFIKPSISSIFFLLFYFLYILKMAFTVFFYPEVFNVGTDLFMYFFSSICFVFIPSISVVMSLKFITFDQVLIYSFFLTMVTLLLSIFKMNNIFSGAITDRLNGNIAISTITFGNIGVTLFCLAIHVFSINRLFRILSAFAITLSIFTVIISGSRGPILALFICIITAILFRNIQKRFSFIFPLFILGLFVILSSYIISLIGLFSSASAGRILLTLTDGDSGGRDGYFPVAIDQFLKSPLLGGSFVLDDGVGKGDYPHNIFLEGLMTFGIFGGIILFVFSYLGFKLSFKLLYLNNKNKWLAFLFFQFFLYSCLSGALWSSIHFVVILAILFNIKPPKFNLIKT
jgi:O-antigen ligase